MLRNRGLVGARAASANLEYMLVMVDDDLNMVVLPKNRNCAFSVCPVQNTHYFSRTN